MKMPSTFRIRFDNYDALSTILYGIMVVCYYFAFSHVSAWQEHSLLPNHNGISTPRIVTSLYGISSISNVEPMIRDTGRSLLFRNLFDPPVPYIDPVLADPVTKQPLKVTLAIPPIATNNNFNNNNNQETIYTYTLQNVNDNCITYTGRSDTYLNLLNRVNMPNSTTNVASTAANNFFDSKWFPPQIRYGLALSGLPFTDPNYIPMRDLFTSPAVSFAYERGWRQGFQRAGFPGPDTEAQMAESYFAASSCALDPSNNVLVLVDMSCATGLFTRRFATSNVLNYRRVLGCDYSDSMLTEARRRIQNDPQLRKLARAAIPSSLSSLHDSTSRSLELVRLDVGAIPMRNNSVDFLHAGAAMHCWPDLPMAASEIYRVLKPGGRYFATTVRRLIIPQTTPRLKSCSFFVSNLHLEISSFHSCHILFSSIFYCVQFLSSYFSVLQRSSNSFSKGSEPSQSAFQYFASVKQLQDLMISGGFTRDNVNVEVLGRACVVIRCEK
jgi:ubiquinone/menaquinone biosynthesis C-methylase UbiE